VPEAVAVMPAKEEKGLSLLGKKKEEKEPQQPRTIQAGGGRPQGRIIIRPLSLSFLRRQESRFFRPQIMSLRALRGNLSL